MYAKIILICVFAIYNNPIIVCAGILNKNTLELQKQIDIQVDEALQDFHKKDKNHKHYHNFGFYETVIPNDNVEKLDLLLNLVNTALSLRKNIFTSSPKQFALKFSQSDYNTQQSIRNSYYTNVSIYHNLLDKIANDHHFLEIKTKFYDLVLDSQCRDRKNEAEKQQCKETLTNTPSNPADRDKYMRSLKGSLQEKAGKFASYIDKKSYIFNGFPNFGKDIKAIDDYLSIKSKGYIRHVTSKAYDAGRKTISKISNTIASKISSRNKN